jgi:type II secretory pathway predicted ATPase ExeA
MYESFFELKCKPFSLLPDPDFLFLSSRHSIALSLLEYSLTGQAGFCVITGDIGSGKTTLVRAFLGRVGRDFTVGLISNTHHAIHDIAGWALTAFGQKQKSNNPAEVYQELLAHLIAEYGAGRQCILIVDEAQNLSIEALEELRLLSNINSGKDLLLQTVLVGQPELLEKLQRPELRQFAQRIAVSHHLRPFNYAESRQYIEHRLVVSGALRPIFTDMAVGAIQYFSGGVPRVINSICDLALVYAFADGVREIDEALVFRVIADRQLSGIAPFAHTISVDDPALHAEISNITQAARAASKSVEAPAVATVRAPQVVPEPTMLSQTPEQAPVETAPAALAGPAEEALLQRIAPTRAAPPTPKPTPAIVEKGTKDRPAAVAQRGHNEYYFDDEDDDLLLMSEVHQTDVLPAKISPIETHGFNNRIASNAAPRPRIVPITADAQETIPGSSPRLSGGTSESDPDDGRSPVLGSLRAEESLRQIAPAGTTRRSERSWWRRAFRREG